MNKTPHTIHLPGSTVKAWLARHEVPVILDGDWTPPESMPVDCLTWRDGGRSHVAIRIDLTGIKGSARLCAQAEYVVPTILTDDMMLEWFTSSIVTDGYRNLT